MSVHENFAFPAITFASTGAEDLLLESYPPGRHVDYQVTRANESVDSSKIFNFFHIWDETPTFDCQLGYVCAWRRKTVRSNTTDVDRDGKVDAHHLHAEEVRHDKDGDGDVDSEDDMPTKDEADQRHMELIYGDKDDVTHRPMIHYYLGNNQQH